MLSSGAWGSDMKRMVVCLDGTWQTLEQTKLTNIAIIARSIAHSDAQDGKPTVPQIVIYSQGVGASTNAIERRSLLGKANKEFERLAGGLFGEGLEDTLLETYVRLCFNFEPGDEIYLFGFSRGAFMARSLAGLIECAGILSRRHVEYAWDAFTLYRSKPRDDAPQDEKDEHTAKARSFRMEYGKGSYDENGRRAKSDEAPAITYMGIFDTVGQRGAPDAFGWFSRLLNRRFGFHNLQPCQNVLAGRHAVSIDECRLGFPPTLWDNLDDANKRVGSQAFEQHWFAGMHGDVGGGVGSRLSATPLRWIVQGAEAVGLKFYQTEESPYLQEMKAAGLSYDGKITSPSLLRMLTPMNLPVRTRRIWRKPGLPSETDAEKSLHVSVAKRAVMGLRPRYRPAPIRPFRKLLVKLAERTPDQPSGNQDAEARPRGE